jgi:hypothetical protein
VSTDARSSDSKKPRGAFFEIIVAAFGLLALLMAQWMLTSAIHGTNYDGGDGKMTQATILAATKFGGLFQVTNINPVEGVGSQLLPLNVWANPSYWPFHIFFSQATSTGWRQPWTRRPS